VTHAEFKTTWKQICLAALVSFAVALTACAGYDKTVGVEFCKSHSTDTETCIKIEGRHHHLKKHPESGDEGL